jgi:hypothetical protein
LRAAWYRRCRVAEGGWGSAVKVHDTPSRQCPSSAPAPPQGAPGGPGQLGTPMKRPAHWAPSHGLGCSSQPPRKPQASKGSKADHLAACRPFHRV